MKLLIINGPNINLLGLREPELYGKNNYAELCRLIRKTCESLDVDYEIFQSNYEGAIIDKIQDAYSMFDGIIINAAAYSHTSIAILDALKAVDIPTVEVHITDISQREDFRRFSYISLVARDSVSGCGIDGYRVAIEKMIQILNQ